MHQEAGILILIFVVASLFIGSAVRNLLKGTCVPYTVTLLIIGLGLGLVQRSDFFHQYLPTVSATLDLVSDIEPHLILFLFLPTLIFESVFAMEVHLFRRIFSQIATLAVPGMILAATATAVLAKYLFPWDWSWTLCFMFGALVSATDPVAVVALLKEVSSRKRLETLLEGESLVNDGTAIVLFTLFYGLLTTQGGTDVSILNVTGNFFWVIMLGLSIGVMIGGLAIFWIGRVFNDPIIEITVSIASAYLVFLLAENVFHVSGVVALVALALLFAGVGRTRISPEVSDFLSHFWEMMAHIANTIIFLLVGIVIASRVPLHDPDLWITLLVLYLGVQVIRAMTIIVFMPVLKRVGIGITWEKTMVLIWGGLRGAVSLALALIVAQDPAFPSALGDQVLFLCAGLVVLTILINGTTMGAVLAWLQLDRLPPGKRATAERTRHRVVKEQSVLLSKLQSSEFLQGADWNQVQTLVSLQDSEASTTEAASQKASEQSQVIDFRRRLLEAERRHYWTQFKEGTLGRTATHRLLEAVEHALDGEPQIHPRADLQILWRMPGVVKYLRHYQFLNSLLVSLSFARLVLGYDTARGFIKAQDEVAQHIDELAPTQEEAEAVRREVLLNKRETYEYIEQFRLTFPEIICALETNAASRILLNHERKVIQDLLDSAVLEKSEAERMLTDVESRMAALQKLPVQISRPEDPALLITRTNWAQGLRQSTIESLLAAANQQLYGANDIIIQQDTKGAALGIVSRGTVEISVTRNGKEQVINILAPRAIIGEHSLLSGINSQTIRAITPVSIIWLEMGMLKPIISKDEMLAARISQLLSSSGAKSSEQPVQSHVVQ